MPRPYTPHDNWSQRATLEGYRARSVYKLIELDRRFHLLRSGLTVLDLGAAPGSWLQYASSRVGSRGKVIGIDLCEIQPVAPNVITCCADITDTEGIASLLHSLLPPQNTHNPQHTGPKATQANQANEALPAGRQVQATEACVDLVLSDAAPATSGIKDIDQWRSIELAQAVIDIAARVLRPQGSCLVKVFRGADFDEFLRELRSKWREVRAVSAKASRDCSREIYLLLHHKLP